jgi:hypothetical protein
VRFGLTLSSSNASPSRTSTSTAKRRTAGRPDLGARGRHDAAPVAPTVTAMPCSNAIVSPSAGIARRPIGAAIPWSAPRAGSCPPAPRRTRHRPRGGAKSWNRPPTVAARTTPFVLVRLPGPDPGSASQNGMRGVSRCGSGS